MQIKNTVISNKIQKQMAIPSVGEDVEKMRILIYPTGSEFLYIFSGYDNFGSLLKCSRYTYGLPGIYSGEMKV